MGEKLSLLCQQCSK